MSGLMQIILLKLLYIVSISAQCNTKHSVVGGNACLPASLAQREQVAANVCDELGSDEETVKKCIDGWRSEWNVDQDVSGLRERCQLASKEYYSTLEVHPSKHFQVILLVPEPNDDDPDSVKYKIVDPDSKFPRIQIEYSTNYSVYSAVLFEDYTPMVWHRETTVQGYEALPRRAYDVQVTFNVTGHPIHGLISWNRTGDLDACFDLFTTCTKTDNPYSILVRKITPDLPTSIIIKDLPANDTCIIKLIGYYGTTEFLFRTPATKEIEFKWMGDIHLAHEEDGDKLTIHVTWPKQPVTPDSYNVSLLTDDHISVAVPGNATEAYLRGVTGAEGEFYYVSVFAVLRGEWMHHSAHGQFPRRASGGRAGVLRWAAAAGTAWAAVLLAALLYWLRSCRANVAPKLIPAKVIMYRKPAELPSLQPVVVEPTPAADAWEIKPGRLTLHEVIGQGAFGVVRRGTLAPLGKEVAVKMLKDFPSAEERREFAVEMELMKSVGAHPHIVSLVGCVTTRHGAIVAEYCSHGDLLNFLRCAWDVMLSKRKANNNNISTSEYGNDDFRWKVPQENSRLVVNRMYDLQEMCDTELSSADLLSFCRQIAMGMEFLALNKVVHRDLAARNILVTRDRTLKIADFGLSRDVYERNQYKQKSNGKIPVKWMALESLTRGIYTTQSDVWSFGVVAWEVVTMGGAPYPGVETARIPRLLRAGYRMPRPPNCSAQMYELMRACWSARPRDRPTFAELHARLDRLLHAASAADYLCLELEHDPPAPPEPRYHAYLRMILRAKRSWSRSENYERPLKAPRNIYTSPPVPYRSPV